MIYVSPDYLFRLVSPGVQTGSLWDHQMDAFSVLVASEFPSQRASNTDVGAFFMEVSMDC